MARAVTSWIFKEWFFKRSFFGESLFRFHKAFTMQQSSTTAFRIFRGGLYLAILVYAVVMIFGLSPIQNGPSQAQAAGEHELGYDDTPFLPNSQWRVHDVKRPQPVKVEPGEKASDAPADAVVLFNGKDVSEWENVKDPAVPPVCIEDGVINIKKTLDGLRTKKTFGDCQLHIEWMVPTPADAAWGDWGNSGVYMLGKYEIQVIESHDSICYSDGQAGSVYGQTPPAVLAARKPGVWQSYDIAFTPPRFEGDKLVSPAYVTVFWNGVLVQNHTPILGPTTHAALTNYETTRESTGPVSLQNHGSAVKYRNIWIRPFKPAE
jgi:hypothetical protein